MSTSFAVRHVRVQASQGFSETVSAFERQLGKLEASTLSAAFSSGGTAEEVRARLDAAIGPSGFAVFGTVDHGALLTAFGERRKAVQYVIGNPLIAFRMTSRDSRAGLYVPLRLLIHEENGTTFVEYDEPSSLLGQLGDPEIDEVASMLDAKVRALVAATIEDRRSGAAECRS